MRILIIMFLFIPFSVCHSFEISSSSRYLSTERIFQEGTFTNPIHENLTVAAIKKAEVMLREESFDVDFIMAVVNGSRWNDDPLSLMEQHKKDFIVHFIDACKESRADEIDVTWDLFYRSHCGDMQFLHSMASRATERADVTTTYIKTWLEFMYKVSIGVIPADYRFRSVQDHMTPQGAKIFKEIMISKYGGRAKWTPQLMFSMKCDRDFNFNMGGRVTQLKCKYKNLSKKNTMDMGLGSLLHIVQDSYTKSHTLRNENGVVQYGYYKMQSTLNHKKADKKYIKIQGVPELTAVSAEIISMVVQDRKEENNNWVKFTKLVNEKLFSITDTNLLPGDLGYD